VGTFFYIYSLNVSLSTDFSLTSSGREFHVNGQAATEKRNDLDPGSVVRRGVVGWRHEDVAMVQRLKLEDKSLW